MKLFNILENLLIEATPDEIYKKYYSDIPDMIFKKIIKSDPQTKVDNNGIKSIGKYSKLLLKLYRDGNLNLEDLPNANEYLGHIYKRNIPVDINKINSLSDLYEMIKNFLIVDSHSLDSLMDLLSKDEYEIKHNGDKWFIITPKTEKAACYLGVNTQWCTTWGKYSLNKNYKDRSNRFAYYSNKGPLYIIINKEDLNDKYQFHFEDKQFMDLSNKQINTGEFLNNNPEIEQFFFPSLYNENPVSDVEMSKINVLSNEKSISLLKKITQNSKNPLVNAIISSDLNQINDLIQTSKNVPDIYVKQNYLTIEIKRLSGSLYDVHQYVRYYEMSKDESRSQIYDDLQNRFYDEEEWKVSLEYLFEKYYEQNKDKVRQELGINNYKNFYEIYYDNFYNEDKIKDAFFEQLVDKSDGNYEAAADEYIKDIKDYISFGASYSTEEVFLNKTKFLIFLIEKGLNKIDNIEDVINSYVEENDLVREIEGVFDYDLVYPEFKDMEYDIDNFFEEYYDKSDESVSICVKPRNKFNEIIKQVFDGQYSLDNEHVYIDITSPKIDCENETVNIIYKNKDTGKQYKGNVKIDNLASYATNYQLFENILRIKNLSETVKNGKVTCDECGWEWKLSDGGDDPYVCHKCGHDNKKKKDDTAKFITCKNCRKKFTQTIHKGKKSLPICPTCGTHNK